MKSLLLCVVLILVYAVLIGPFADHMQEKPYVEKLGYVPEASVIRFLAADHAPIFCSGLVFKVQVYFGSLVEQAMNKVYLRPDFPGMYKMVKGALSLDPYNMDAYYFSQAILVWDMGRIEEANELLVEGMKYRTWDWYLPFFAGFNYAYFLKDYENAAKYYKKAAEISGADLYTRLAARYMYQSGNTAHAISFLSVMIESARNESIKESFSVRLKALQGIRAIELALERWQASSMSGRPTVTALVDAGFLAGVPDDPYGGEFYIDESNVVKTTSNMSYEGAKKSKQEKESGDGAKQ